MKMKLLYLLCALVVTGTAFADNKRIKGNGRVKTTEISITDYDKISVSGGSIEMIYEQSTAVPYLEVTVDENILPYLDIEVKNNQLKVGVKKEGRNSYNIQPTVYKIKTNSHSLVQMKSSGSGKYAIKNVNHSGTLEANLSGSGSVNYEQVTVNTLKADLSGSGSVNGNGLNIGSLRLFVSGSSKSEISGKVDNGEIRISGSGSVKGYNCDFGSLSAQISGSGKIEAKVIDKLDATVSGSGNISYKGRPVVNTRTSGSGKIVNTD